MKKGYKIGLFFICTIIIILIIILMWKRHTISGFPNENINNEIQQENDIKNNNSELKKNEIDTSQAQKVNIITTEDTVCIYENIDKKDGAVSMSEEAIPAKYIGLDRKELEKALQEDTNTLLLENDTDYFKSQHLELFSPEKIKILRIYDTTSIVDGYFIMEVEGEIRIYEEDRETLYFRTDLVLDDLPDDVKQEVIDGKFMETEVQVYHFLESYSS